MSVDKEEYHHFHDRVKMSVAHPLNVLIHDKEVQGDAPLMIVIRLIPVQRY